jgi:elongation factor P
VRRAIDILSKESKKYFRNFSGGRKNHDPNYCLETDLGAASIPLILSDFRLPLEKASTINYQPFPLMAAANDLRKGMAIKYNGNTAIVLEVNHRTPGNLRAFVQAIIRYISTGKSADVRFGSTDKVELVDMNRNTLEFSYKDHSGYHFMDPNTFETVTLNDDLLADAKEYLVENLPVEVLSTGGRPVQVELPSSVKLKVVEAPEGLRGDTASNVTKPAILESGKTVNVPLFIQEGETVKIDTRTGAYMGRA